MPEKTKSLLTGEITPEITEIKEKERREWELAETISSGWLEAYQEGEINFDKLLEKSRLAVAKLPNRSRWLLFGEVIDKALNSKPPQLGKHKPKTASWIKKAVVGLVDMAVEEDGCKLSLVSNHSAFVYIAELLVGYGVMDKLAPKTVHNWYYDY
ncbi:MAG: hypothetical protein GY934_16025 [Gammaproteobacteria bacterium]|nr:hypothetical protein [Gammaproteobacteria bacterium]